MARPRKRPGCIDEDFTNPAKVKLDQWQDENYRSRITRCLPTNVDSEYFLKEAERIAYWYLWQKAETQSTRKELADLLRYRVDVWERGGTVQSLSRAERNELWPQIVSTLRASADNLTDEKHLKTVRLAKSAVLNPRENAKLLHEAAKQVIFDIKVSMKLAARNWQRPTDEEDNFFDDPGLDTGNEDNPRTLTERWFDPHPASKADRADREAVLYLFELWTEVAGELPTRRVATENDLNLPSDYRGPVVEICREVLRPVQVLFGEAPGDFDKAVECLISFRKRETK